MVVVEALACGTPVVATRCGGPEEIITTDRVGVLVPPEDPEALARGIEQALDRQPRYDPAELRAHALNRFGVDSVAARVNQVYEETVRDYRSAPAQSPDKSKLAAPLSG